MSKLHKSLMLVLFIVLAVGALLAPGPRLQDSQASLQPGTQETQSVALMLLPLPEDPWAPCGFTWAG